MEHQRYSIWIIALSVLASVFLQSKLALWMRYGAWLDLPLIVTLYFGLSLRQPLRGLSVGLVTGLLQDALSHGPVGMNGLTKTVVGFLASSLSGWIDVDHALIRLGALWVFSAMDMALFALTERMFFPARFSWASYHFVYTPTLNAVVGLPIFLLLDRLRKKD